MSNPTLLIAHHPSLKLIRSTELEALAEVVELLHPEPVANWADVADLLPETDIVLGHWGCPTITPDVQAAAGRLGLVAYAAGTVKTVITESIFETSIRVTSCADVNAEPVADYTLAMILLANKDALWRHAQSRDPGVELVRPPRRRPVGNWAKTIGLVGASLVGRLVIERLAPFAQFDILVSDPYLDSAEAARLGVSKVDLDELCERSDIVSIHAPDLPSTHHMIGAPQLEAMVDGAVLINTARGRLVDHDALTTEVLSGRITAILDVTDPEPLPSDHPLRSAPGAFLTPHLAGSEGTELSRLFEGALDEIERFIAGAAPRNPVTASHFATMA